MYVKAKLPIRMFPTEKEGWWRFSFYSVETMVVGMTIRLQILYTRSSHLQYPPAFYYILLSAIVTLLIVSIAIRRSSPIHSKFGFITLVAVCFFAFQPTYQKGSGIGVNS
jgi:hypothetical protein